MSEIQLLPSKIVQPPKPWQVNDQVLEDQRQLFESYLCEFQRQEESGMVQASVVIETILTAWTLRSKLWRYRKEQEFLDKILDVADIAKKYGYSRLWNAKMYGTLNDRLSKLQVKEGVDLPQKHHCGRCGRAIWNPLSVRRGVGPVCYHKRGS